MSKTQVRYCYIKEKDLKKLRKRKGLSFRDLMGLSGVNISILQKAENGNYILKSEDWDKIASILDNLPDKR